MYCVNANEQKYSIVRAQPLVQLGRKSGWLSAAPSKALNSAHRKKKERKKERKKESLKKCCDLDLGV